MPTPNDTAPLNYRLTWGTRSPLLTPDLEQLLDDYDWQGAYNTMNSNTPSTHPSYEAHRLLCIEAITRMNAGRGEPSRLIDEYIEEAEHGDSSYWSLFAEPEHAAHDYVIYMENREPDA